MFWKVLAAERRNSSAVLIPVVVSFIKCCRMTGFVMGVAIFGSVRWIASTSLP